MKNKGYFLSFSILIIGCSNVVNIDNSYSNIFVGNWTQVEYFYKGPPVSSGLTEYASWEIHFVSKDRWTQCLNFNGDSTVITNWYYFIRNDSLCRSLDNNTIYYVGLISKVNDTIIIDEPVVKFKYARYNSDSLPADWPKIVINKQ